MLREEGEESRDGGALRLDVCCDVKVSARERHESVLTLRSWASDVRVLFACEQYESVLALRS